MNFLHLTWATLKSNYVNILLVFVPVGIVIGALDLNPTAVFIVNFMAIIPLAALLSFATEELSAKMGQTLGGLMNASFGNAVELIVSFVQVGCKKRRLTFPGLHHCAQGRPDSDRASQYAWLHPFEHPLGAWVLFHLLRTQARREPLQRDRCLNYVLTHGSSSDIPHHPSNTLCFSFKEQCRRRCQHSGAIARHCSHHAHPLLPLSHLPAQDAYSSLRCRSAGR